MNKRTVSNVLLVFSVALLGGCASIKWTPPEKIVWNPPTPFPIGAFEFVFSKERERIVSHVSDLSGLEPDAGQTLVQLHEYGFAIAPPPKGCKSFDSAKFKDFALTEDGFKHVTQRVEDTERRYGWVPDDMALALAIYRAPAFRATCGDAVVATLQADSRINGWRLTENTRKVFESIGQGDVSLQPAIVIVAVPKAEFHGRLKPTATNLLMSRYRFEIPPNYDSVAADPQVGTVLLTYTQKLENVRVKEGVRDRYLGGIVRVFTGDKFLYLVDVSAFRPQTSTDEWATYRQYLDTIRYVGAKAQ